MNFSCSIGRENLLSNKNILKKFNKVVIQEKLQLRSLTICIFIQHLTFPLSFALFYGMFVLLHGKVFDNVT